MSSLSHTMTSIQSLYVLAYVRQSCLKSGFYLAMFACKATLQFSHICTTKKFPPKFRVFMFINIICFFSRNSWTCMNLRNFLRKWYQFSVRNTKVYKIRKLCRAIFFSFYNISRPNFAILLILGCSSMLWL